jgi:hypothetical protein
MIWREGDIEDDNVCVCGGWIRRWIVNNIAWMDDGWMDRQYII